jgi:hypothetical protein
MQLPRVGGSIPPLAIFIEYQRVTKIRISETQVAITNDITERPQPCEQIELDFVLS